MGSSQAMEQEKHKHHHQQQSIDDMGALSQAEGHPVVGGNQNGQGFHLVNIK